MVAEPSELCDNSEQDANFLDLSARADNLVNLARTLCHNFVVKRFLFLMEGYFNQL